MLRTIRDFLTELSSTEEPEALVHDRLQLAEAALMYHVIAVDGVVHEDEQIRMNAVLERHFGLSTEETEELAESAITADKEAVDLYGFTSILKRALEEDERIKIVEHLWEMVYADGVAHELEENMVWRISELLAINSRDRIAMKQKVRDRTPDQEQAERGG